MAKYKVIKPVSFGPYTIKDKDGYDAPLQNYAPKVGTIIEGNVESGHLAGVPVMGIKYPVMTNGVNSNQSQISIQTIPLEYLEEINNSADEPKENPVITDKEKNTTIAVIASLVIIVTLGVIAIVSIWKSK